MSTYAAFLGNQPTVSLLELAGLLPDMSIEHTFGKQVVVFSTQYELDQYFLDQLGGTIVLAKAVSTQSLELSDVPKVLHNELSKAKKGKVIFSLRTVGLAPKHVRGLYRECKDHLKYKERSSRYVGSEKKAALPVVLHENDMIAGKQACELTILQDEDTLWIGRTVAAHNIDAYTKRDVQKPVRDTTVGLLPPKLAQTLLNLGVFAVQQKTGKTPKAPKWKLPNLRVFDPFCGTGVIPMEALLRGWNVQAADKSQKAVTGCSTNLDWLRKEEKIAKKDVASTVWKQDATKPYDLKDLPDVIVTETTLGPPLKKRATVKEVQSHKKENELLQAATLQNFATCFPGVPIVCTWPVWYHSKGQTPLEKVWQTAQECGYHLVLPSLEGFERNAAVIYRRKEQFVGRQIVVLIPEKK